MKVVFLLIPHLFLFPHFQFGGWVRVSSQQEAGCTVGPFRPQRETATGGALRAGLGVGPWQPIPPRSCPLSDSCDNLGPSPTYPIPVPSGTPGNGMKVGTWNIWLSAMQPGVSLGTWACGLPGALWNQSVHPGDPTPQPSEALGRPGASSALHQHWLSAALSPLRNPPRWHLFINPGIWAPPSTPNPAPAQGLGSCPF